MRYSARVVARFREIAVTGAPEACWPWPGYRQPNGYGYVNVGKEHAPAHRLALLLSGVEVPKGHDVCHRCDNRACINPAHLYPGTRRQNMADCTERRRHNKPRGEAHWRSKLSAEQVLEIRRRRELGESCDSLGAAYAVNPATISRIARRVWRTEIP